MKFTLSSSQLKEILVRARPLLIALPLQQDCETDEAAAQLAREWLVLPDGCRVVSATVDEVAVTPPQRCGGPDRLSSVLGMIQRDLSEQRWLTARHVVIMAYVVPRGETRHNAAGPHWPGGTLRVGDEKTE